jgi:hypothetical protein
MSSNKADFNFMRFSASLTRYIHFLLQQEDTVGPNRRQISSYILVLHNLRQKVALFSLVDDDDVVDKDDERHRDLSVDGIEDN